MKKIVLPLSILIALSSCFLPQSPEDKAKSAQQDSLDKVAARQHLLVLDELAQLMMNDTVGEYDTICNLDGAKKERMAFNVIESRLFFHESDSLYTNAGQWSWINTAGYNHIGSASAEFRESDIGKSIRKNKDLTSPYLLVIEELEAQMPVLAKDESSFEAGYFTGMVYVFDYDAKKMICAFPFWAESSQTIEFKKRKILGSNAASKLEKDMKANFENSLRDALKKRTGCSKIILRGIDAISIY
ncbi:MAG: hypothetical protein ACRCYO_00975 [Bacteroidia bacterium]